MKFTVFGKFYLALVCVLLIGLPASIHAQQAGTLAKAISGAVEYLKNHNAMPQGSGVAFVGFAVTKQAATQALANRILRGLRTGLTGFLNVELDSQTLDLSREELALMDTGTVRLDSEQRRGRWQGINFFVDGSIALEGDVYVLNVWAIGTESRVRVAEFESYVNKNDPELKRLLRDNSDNDDSQPNQNAHFWSVGASVGTSFTTPWVIGTIRGTIAPFRYSFLELGVDGGFLSGIPDVTYYSVYPFAHYAFFLPFNSRGGWYIGGGIGFMLASESGPGYTINPRIIAADAVTGVNILNVLDISYTLHTDFASAGSKLSVGYTYRFQ